MSDALNEFAINLPMATIGGVGAVPAPEAPVDMTSCVEVPAEVNASLFSHISVYLDQVTIASFNVEDPCVCIDMVLSVNVTNPTANTTNSYKLVKRLSFDKVKLALQAEQLTPVQVIEHVQEEDPLIVEQEAAEYKVRVRARELAGIFESNGKLEATVLFKYKDKDGANCSGSVTYKAIESKAHARHVFDAKIDKKRFPEARITRVTLKDPAEKKD